MDLFYQIISPITETVHWMIFLVWIYTFYRIVRYKYTPYSNIYAGLIISLQCVYNGCPIASVQEYLATIMKEDLVGNAFLGNIFQSYTDIFRVVFIIISIVLFYASYQQFNKLDIKPKYWLNFWNEGLLNSKEFSPEKLA